MCQSSSGILAFPIDHISICHRCGKLNRFPLAVTLRELYGVPLGFYCMGIVLPEKGWRGGMYSLVKDEIWLWSLEMATHNILQKTDFVIADVAETRGERFELITSDLNLALT